MPSPDFTRYIDLSIYDEEARSSLSDILSYARGLLPTWNPEAGQIETALAEAMAVKSAELTSAINRLPGATVETLLKLFGITRDDGTQATGTITITFSDSDSVARTLPAGTRFLYYSAVDGVSYTFELVNDFTLSGSLSGDATVRSVVVGTDYNLSASGESLVVLSSATYFVSAVFNGITSGGTNEETDDAYFDRAVNTLASYTSASVTPDQIKSFVLANKAYANRVAVYDQRRYRDRNTTATSYTTHPGYALVAVAGTMSEVADVVSDLTVSAQNLSDLNDSLTARVPSGVIIDVMTVEIAEVDVDVSFVKLDGFASSTVTTAVVNAIQEYINPNSWDLSVNTIRVNEIISLVDSIAGVDYVTEVKFNGQSLLGTNNVGYYSLTGGTAASATVDISGATSGSIIPEGSKYYYVDTSNPGNPVIYNYELAAEVTVDGSGNYTGATLLSSQAGQVYNDTSNGGNVAPASSFTGATSALGTATATSDLSGGTDDSNRYTAFPVGASIAADVILSDLGTLPVYGTINLTIT